MHISLVGVEVKSSFELVREELVHVPFFYTGFTSQLDSSQELTRAATGGVQSAGLFTLCWFSEKLCHLDSLLSPRISLFLHCKHWNVLALALLDVVELLTDNAEHLPSL